MSAQALVRELTWFVYLLIFLYVAWEVVREPRRATIDTALFFGLIAFVIITIALRDIGVLAENALLEAIIGPVV